MTEPGATPRNPTEDLAARWAVRLDNGALGANEQAELDSWLEAKSVHKGALLRARAALALATKTEMTVDTAVASPPRASPNVPARWRINRRAAIIAGLGTTGSALLASRSIFQADEISTDIGEIRRMPLADGSTVALDTRTRIVPRLSQRVRLVQLDQGRVLFDVAHDPSRPFIVEAGDVRVRAVGTIFSVERGESVTVLVTEGIIEVTRGELVRRLVTNERLELGSEAIAATPTMLAQDDVARALDWRDGRLELDGESLVEAAAQMNRYNRRQIVIADQRVADARLYGGFRTDDPEGFARAAVLSVGGTVYASDTKIVIGR